MAEEASLVRRKELHIPGVGKNAPSVGYGVPAGDDCPHSSKLLGSTCIDVQYPRVGVGAAEHFGIKHAWQIEIGGELGFTLSFGDRVGSRGSLSYYGIV